MACSPHLRSRTSTTQSSTVRKGCPAVCAALPCSMLHCARPAAGKHRIGWVALCRLLGHRHDCDGRECQALPKNKSFVGRTSDCCCDPPGARRAVRFVLVRACARPRSSEAVNLLDQCLCFSEFGLVTLTASGRLKALSSRPPAALGFAPLSVGASAAGDCHRLRFHTPDDSASALGLGVRTRHREAVRPRPRL